MANRRYFGQLYVTGGAAGQVLVGGVAQQLTQFTGALPATGGENWGTTRSLGVAVGGLARLYSIKVAHSGAYRLNFDGRFHSTAATRVLVSFYRYRAGAYTSLGSAALTFQAPLEEQSCSGSPVVELRSDDEITIYLTADLATTLTLIDGNLDVQGVNPIMSPP